MLVLHTRTPILLTDLPELVDAGYHTAIGTCPGLDALAILIAMLVQEHGRAEGKLWAVWCNNLGNVDATDEERADDSIEIFTTVPECEGPSCSARYVHARRAWSSAAEGAEAFVRSLRERDLEAFLELGNGPEAFIDALKAAGYFTGSVDVYMANVVSLTRTAASWIRDWRGP